MAMAKGGIAPAAMLSSRAACGGHVEQLGAIRLPGISCARSSAAIRASHKPEEERSVIKSKVLAALVAAGASLALNTAAPVWSAHAGIPFRADVERNATPPHFPGNDETCTKVGDTSCLGGNRENEVRDNSTVGQASPLGEGRQAEETLNLKELASSEEAQQVKDAAGDVAKGAAQTVVTKAAQDFATTQLGVPGALASTATQLVTKVVNK